MEISLQRRRKKKQTKEFFTHNSFRCLWFLSETFAFERQLQLNLYVEMNIDQNVF